ncbi:MAG: hypothetical protein ABMA64_09960 [Myxococcota bacterium]
MAHSWQFDLEESVTLEAFVAWFQSRGTEIFSGDLEEPARMMRRLANNRTLLVDWLNRRLGDLASFQSENFYTPQVFVLHAERNFVVRVNLWVPPVRRPGEEMFLYEEAHDHNFDFFTVGYLGPGYRTRIYEYDHAEVVGYPGEAVSASLLEETTLPFGKVMMFRSGRDIHTQYPPEEFSISVNVLGQLPEVPPDQYVFDIEGGRVGQKINASAGLVPIKLAGLLGDRESEQLLTELTDHHPARRLRLAAREALAMRIGVLQAWKSGVEDPDPLIRRFARRVASA